MYANGNVIEIEGLLFPGFGQTPACKYFPTSDVMSRARSKFFNWKSSVLSTLVTSLDGKNWFSMERVHWAKTQE